MRQENKNSYDHGISASRPWAAPWEAPFAGPENVAPVCKDQSVMDCTSWFWETREACYYMTGAIGGDIVIFEPCEAPSFFRALTFGVMALRFGHTPRFDSQRDVVGFFALCLEPGRSFRPKNKPDGRHRPDEGTGSQGKSSNGPSACMASM